MDTTKICNDRLKKSLQPGFKKMNVTLMVEVPTQDEAAKFLGTVNQKQVDGWEPETLLVVEGTLVRKGTWELRCAVSKGWNVEFDINKMEDVRTDKYPAIAWPTIQGYDKPAEVETK
jgi:hypothetical protein